MSHLGRGWLLADGLGTAWAMIGWAILRGWKRKRPEKAPVSRTLETNNFHKSNSVLVAH